MQLSLVPKKERISVDEYYRLRHTLLGLRRQYAQAVYGSNRDVLPTDTIDRLERKIEAMERRLAYADVNFDIPYETLFHDIIVEVRDKLSGISLKSYVNSLKQIFTGRTIRFGT